MFTHTSRTIRVNEIPLTTGLQDLKEYMETLLADSPSTRSHHRRLFKIGSDKAATSTELAYFLWLYKSRIK